MWKNSPSVSMIMAAPFPSGWEQPEHNLFPLTHLHTQWEGKRQMGFSDTSSNFEDSCSCFCVCVPASLPAGWRRLRWWRGGLLLAYHSIMWFRPVVEKRTNYNKKNLYLLHTIILRTTCMFSAFNPSLRITSQTNSSSMPVTWSRALTGK